MVNKKIVAVAIVALVAGIVVFITLATRQKEHQRPAQSTEALLTEADQPSPQESEQLSAWGNLPVAANCLSQRALPRTPQSCKAARN